MGEACPSGYGCDYDTGWNTGTLGNNDGHVASGSSWTVINELGAELPHTKPQVAPVYAVPTMTDVRCTESNYLDQCSRYEYTPGIVYFDSGNPVKALDELRGTLINQIGLCQKNSGIATLRQSDAFVNAACGAYESIDTTRREIEKLTPAELSLIVIGIATVIPLADAVVDAGFCGAGLANHDKTAVLDCTAVLAYNGGDVAQLTARAAKVADEAADTAHVAKLEVNLAETATNRAGMDSFLDNGATVHHSGTATAIGDDANTLTNFGRSQGSAGHDVVVHGQVVNGQANFVTNGMPTHTQQIADAVLSNPSYVRGSPVQLVTCHGACGLADELSHALGGARVTASPHLVDLDPATGLLRSWK